MLVELENFLKATTSYETQTLYAKGSFILELYGLNSFEEDLMLVFNNLDNATTEDNLETIYYIFNHYIENVSEELGVEFNETVLLADKIDILEGLNCLPNYGDSSPIITIGLAETTAEEKLSLMLEEIGKVRSERSFPTFSSVSDILIGNIISLMENKLEETPFDDTEFIRERVNKFRTPTRENLKAFELVKEGLRLGTGVEFMLDKLCDDVCELEKQPSLLAEELFAIVLVSNTPDSLVKQTVSELLEQYSADISFVTKGINHLKTLGVLND